MLSEKLYRIREGIKPTNKMGVLILFYLVSAWQTLIFKPKDDHFKVKKKIYALKPLTSRQFPPQLFCNTHGCARQCPCDFDSLYDLCGEMESVSSEVGKNHNQIIV